MKNEYKGIDFLLKIYKDLFNSELVKNSGNGGNKYKDVDAYMERLERITQKGIEHDNLRLMKEAYYNKYVIKPENIPESYFKHQEQIALDRGYGHVHYTDEIKRKEIDQIISEQKSSLDSWIDYFASTDTEMYPTWFKYFCFQGMVRLGYFDKQSEKYTKRTETTTKPFIEINREAIAMVYEELIKVLNKESVDDKKLEELLKSGSFSKTYAYCIKKLNSIKKSKTTDEKGIWKKYLQNSDPNTLFNDIHGKGTGWCTAGGLETATRHLKGGAFYVYFTKDENGEYTCPRIAIRMQNNKIAEIRGIAENQNLESNMEKVVEEKLEEFPDKDEYKKKVKDMENLTQIYTKWKKDNKVELTKEELKFIYEIDEEITGFGYQKDPRIEEILKDRNIKKDLSFALDYKEEQVSTTKEEALKNGIIYHYGDLELNDIESAENITFPKIINGNLYLNGLTNAEGLVLPKILNGGLHLNGLTNAKGVVLPETINGILWLRSLTSAEGLSFPETARGNYWLEGLTSAKGLKLPKTLDGCLWIEGLTSVKDLVLPEEINGSLNLKKLKSAEGLAFPKIINGNLRLNGLTNAEGLVLPEEINGDLEFESLTNAKGLVLPKKINGDLNMGSLKSAEGLVLPKTINGNIDLSGLENAEGLVLPKILNGELHLSGLTSAKDLVLPEEINGEIYLNGLTNAEGLVFPEIINGGLGLCGLIIAEGLMLPKEINGDLYLRNLIEVEGLVLPKIINGSLILDRIIRAKDLVLPETVKGKIYLNSLTSAEGLVLPKTIDEGLVLISLESVKGIVIPDELNCALYCPLANNDINVLKQMCKKKNKTK